MTAVELVRQRVFAALLILLALLVPALPAALLRCSSTSPTAPVSYPLQTSATSGYSESRMNLQIPGMLPVVPAAVEAVLAEALLHRALLHQEPRRRMAR